MPYDIEVHEDLRLLISYITPHSATDDEINAYLKRVVGFGNGFLDTGATNMYHILAVEPRDFNFVSGLRTIRTIQQNRDLIAMRKRLNTMTILVGRTPKPFQILITLLSNASFGGRQMMIFPTLEPALAFVKFDISYRDATPP